MPPMVIAEASVATPLARRYLGQLCKHFEHKRPVTFDERQGRIEFGAGPCELWAEEGTLRLRVSAADADALAQLEDVVARHLVRFAFRDELTVAWNRTTPVEHPPELLGSSSDTR